jgi:hypothetical protein
MLQGPTPPSNCEISLPYLTMGADGIPVLDVVPAIFRSVGPFPNWEPRFQLASPHFEGLGLRKCRHHEYLGPLTSNGRHA